MRKAFVYIDGRNLYHSLEEHGIDAYNFNYKGLVEKVVSGREIVAIKYYCARYPIELDANKHHRDHALYQELEKQGLQVHEGKFKITQDTGRKFAQEKGVDVLLATDLVFDSFLTAQPGGVEDYYIFSLDTDLLPAVRRVKEKFGNVKVYGCQFSTNADWQGTCDNILKIYKNVAKKYSKHAVSPTQDTLQSLADRFNRK